LAVITVALMPSPGNFWNQPSGDKSTGVLVAAETAVQTSTQGALTSQGVDGTADQTMTQPVTQTDIETVPRPVYTNITVVPEEVVVTVNETFKVDIWINNVTNMAGWQVILLWNKQIIKCVDAQVNTPPEWGGVGFDWFNKTEADVNSSEAYTAWLFGSGIENDYNDTYGRYVKAECFGPRGSIYHNVFDGSIPVVTLTFQALQTGSTPLSLSENQYEDGIGLAEAGETKIGDVHAEPIAHFVYSGLVTVQAK